MNETEEGATMNEETSHTPGPWVSAAEIDQFDLGESFPVLAGGAGGMQVCTVHNFDDFPCADEDKAEEFDMEAQANGRLIAASPELLTALDVCSTLLENLAGRKMLRSDGAGHVTLNFTDAVKDARAAINKALGKE